MNLHLVNTEIKIAESDMECDAIRSYRDRSKVDKEFKFQKPQDALFLVYHKDGMIKKGKKYVEREFVDMETGEALLLNAICEVDFVAIRNKIYSPIFLHLLK